MSGEGFLSRWSRRKVAKRVDPREDPSEGDRASDTEVPEAESSTAFTEPETPPVLSDEEIAALPDPATLTAGSDVSAFLRPGVPAALKHAALRRMWSLNPAIATYLDPATEYAWDWNAPGGVPGSGALTAADDAAKAVARLFEGTPRKAAETPAASAPSSSPSLEAVPEPPAPETPEAPALASDEAADPSPQDDSPRRRPRHGGAVPV
jgi:hypothetical protein